MAGFKNMHIYLHIIVLFSLRNAHCAGCAALFDHADQPDQLPGTLAPATDLPPPAGER